MSQIQIRQNMLTAEFEGLDMARARRLSLKIPLESIRAVSVGIPAVALREPAMFWGNYHSGEILVGPEEAYEGHRESFYEVRHPDLAITLELSHGRFEYVVLEPSNVDPKSLVLQIEQILGRHLPGAQLAPGLMESEHPTEPKSFSGAGRTHASTR